MTVSTETGINIQQHLFDKLGAEFTSQEFTREWVSRDMFLAGSTAINGQGNDVDIVVLHNDLDDAAQCLEEAGWETCAAEVYSGINSAGWFSARKGEFNLLVSDTGAYNLWETANRVCLAYRALVDRDTTKEERVSLHKAVFNY